MASLGHHELTDPLPVVVQLINNKICPNSTKHETNSNNEWSKNSLACKTNTKHWSSLELFIQCSLQSNHSVFLYNRLFTSHLWLANYFNSSPPWQNGPHLADDIFVLICNTLDRRDSMLGVDPGPVSLTIFPILFKIDGHSVSFSSQL